MHDKSIGSHNLIAGHQPGLIKKAFHGETVLIPPIITEDSFSKDSRALYDNQPLLYFVVPVREADDSIIAVISYCYDPKDAFMRMSQIGRFGITGETYSFDKNAILLSPSRFKEHLIEMKIITRMENTFYKTQVSIPDKNSIKRHRHNLNERSDHSLTHMAASAIAGFSGINVKGYRDYRGVSVIGAWLWDHDNGIGFASEIDEKEALSSHYLNRRIVYTIALSQKSLPQKPII
jgi:polar amino acid transport system substrate-binding protein